MAQSPFSQWQQPAGPGWEFSSPAPQRPPAWAPCPVLSALSAPPGYIVTSSSLCGNGSLGFPTTDGCAWLPCTGNHQPQRAQQRRSGVLDEPIAGDSCSSNLASQRQPSWEVDPLTAATDYGGYWEPLGRRSFEASRPDAVNMPQSTANPAVAAAAAGYAAAYPAAGQPGGCMGAPMHPQHPSMFSWGPGSSVPYSNSYQQQQQQQAVLYPPAAPAPVVHIQPPCSSSYSAAPCAGVSSSSSRTRASPVTLLCCSPPALPVGLASKVHLFLSGAVPSAAAGAGQMMPAAPGAVQPAPYCLQLSRGHALILEAQGWCSSVNPVISVALPPLAAGTLQLHLSFRSSSNSCVSGSAGESTITHTLLVLPGAAAAELSSYWSELVVAAATTNNSSNICSSSGGCGGQAAPWTPGPPTAAAPAAAGPWAPAAAATAGPGVWSMEVQVNGQLQQLTVHPSAVQSAWRQQYMPLAEDILSLMAPVPAAGSTNTLTGQQQYSCSGQTAEVSVAAREALGGLVERLAGRGMWALLQLLTDQVFGGGSSAKALFSANMAAAAAAAGGAAPADNTAAIAAAAPAAAAAEEALFAAGGAAPPAASDAAPSSGCMGAVGSQELQRSPNTQQLPEQLVHGRQEQETSSSTTHSTSTTTNSSSCQHEAAGNHPDTPPAADLAAALPQTALTRRGASTAAPHNTHRTSSGHGSSRSTSAPSSRRQSQLISSADVAARTGLLEMPEWFEQGLLHSLTSASSGGSEGAIHVDWPSCAGSTKCGKQTSAAAAAASEEAFGKQPTAAAAGPGNPTTAAAASLAAGAVRIAAVDGGGRAGSSKRADDAPSSAGEPSARAAAAMSSPAGLQQRRTMSEDAVKGVNTSTSCHLVGPTASSSNSKTCARPSNSNSAVGRCALLPAWLWQGLLVVLGLLDVAVMAALLAWLLRAL